MADITSANSVFTLLIPGVFPVPQNIQGFAADDAFSNDAVDIAEVRIGVDGIMSSGYLPQITKMTVHLQADSPSLVVFDTWKAAMQIARGIFPATATITMQSISKSYALLNGTLDNIKQLPDAKKVLEPLTYRIAWNVIIASDI